jgi:hypothetical protein
MRLAADVPEGDVDRAEGMNERSAPAGHRSAHVELFPERRRVECVAADEESPEASVRRVRPRRLDTCARDPGVEVGLADSDNALVGLDLDEDGVLRRARGVRVVARIEQHVRTDIDDPHSQTQPQPPSIDAVAPAEDGRRRRADARASAAHRSVAGGVRGSARVA